MKGVEDSSAAAQAILYEGGNADLMKQVTLSPSLGLSLRLSLSLTRSLSLTLALTLSLTLTLTLGHDDDGRDEGDARRGEKGVRACSACAEQEVRVSNPT